MAQAKHSVGEFPFWKAFEGFRPTGFNVAAWMDSQRKTMEAVSAAQRLSAEGVQAVARRQAEIFREVLEGAGEVARTLATEGPTPGAAAKQAELARQAFETGLANTRELTELAVKANQEAADVLSRRFTESLDEFSAVARQVG